MGNYRTRQLADILAENQAGALTEPDFVEEPEEDTLKVKIVPASMTRASIKLHISSIEAITQENNIAGGAALLTLVDPRDGSLLPKEWLPKKLLSNYSAEDNTVYIWEVFLESNKPEIFKAYTSEYDITDEEEGEDY